MIRRPSEEDRAAAEAARPRRRRRPPPALGALMAVSMLLAVTWSAVLPAFQAPDEQSHFAYVQALGARQALPGVSGRPFFSTAMEHGMAAVNSNQVAAQLPVKPEWSDQVEAEWAASEGNAPRNDGGGPGPGTNYPPTAYAWQAIGYAAASGGTLFDQLFWARLMSALWVPITVLATWLLAGEAFGRRRLLQTVAAAVPALLPMFIFVSGSVSPDGMLCGVYTLALWLGVRCVKRGVPFVDGAVFFALVGLACTIKATGYGLLPGAALVAVLGLLARRPWRILPILRVAAIVAVPLALTLGASVILARAENRPAAAQLTQSTVSAPYGTATNLRELLSYLWQYYLPRTPIQDDYRIPPGGYPLVEVWVTQTWGAFGWLEVTFRSWVNIVLAVLTGGIFGAALAAVARARRRIDLRVLGFLVLVFLALLGGLHWTDYHQLEAGALGFMQGRYIFPAIGIFGLALAAAVSLIPVARRGIAVGAAVAGLLAYHLWALGLVVERFYA